MTWWNRKAKTEEGERPNSVHGPEYYAVAPVPGQMPPCDNPKSYADVLEKSLPKITLDPKPDMTTKPENMVSYCIGLSCLKKHIIEAFEGAVDVKGITGTRICGICGSIDIRPAAVKKIYEYRWDYRSRKWGIIATDYPRYEFVHYLDTPKPRRKK